MCKNCNCENFDQCSIVGFLPVGFCCSMCVLYDTIQTCLKTKTKYETPEGAEKIEPISATIEGGLLKVEIRKKGKKIPIYIDLQKQLGSD